MQFKVIAEDTPGLTRRYLGIIVVFMALIVIMALIQPDFTFLNK